MNSMQNCITHCQRCHSTCLRMAMTHCLQQQGKHTEPNHFRLMLDCAAICQLAADFMLVESPFHVDTCRICEKICTACARSCEALDGMEECVNACRECAQSCQQMATDEQSSAAE